MNNKNPRISVVIPTYNRRDVISRAIDSVLEQTINDFEIVIVDDGSIDETSEVVDLYNDDRIRYIQHEENKGQNIARNTGLRAAEGTYISYLDSDDVLLPPHLENAVHNMEELPDDYAGVVTGYEDVVDGKVIPQPGYDGKITYENLIRDMYDKIGGLSLLTFRTDILGKVGFHDEDIVNSTDLDFYLQILEEYNLFGADEILCRRFKQTDSVSMDAELVARGEKTIISKHGDKLTPENRAKRRYNRGIALAELGEMQEASRVFRGCIRDYPYGVLYYYHYAISLLGGRAFHLLAIYPYIRDWHPESLSKNN
ncbi:glycosyltransferase family 2 protein [Halobacterium salinarum]|uniref:glycosyltransferase family 2 protein n=1 Tax=Halobacterium salinarum TaxID=2242 RepID=UPI002552A6F2|nr:glycosyltransferase family 2 protein [Halobacterium salinarum]MDL0121719.1 glycosyltransferase family 2 protein [Halobacterium salinarum]